MLGILLWNSACLIWMKRKCASLILRGLKVHLLSDTGHEALEKYAVWRTKKMYGKEYMGFERSTFIIDPDETVVASW